MVEFMERCFTLDTGGWIVLIMFAGVGYVLFSQILGDHMFALLGTPFLVMGAAIGNVLLADAGVQLAADKGVNGAANMAIGMLAGGIVSVGLLWSWNAMMNR